MCWIRIGSKIGSVKTKVRVSTAKIRGYFGEIVVVAPTERTKCRDGLDLQITDSRNDPVTLGII